MNTKGQNEIIGLVIIVILFIFGFMFAVGLMAKSPQGTEIKKRFYSNELAENFLLALLKTQTPYCRNLTMQTVLEDCYLSKTKCGLGKDSCKVFTNTTWHILNKTLGRQGLDYYLRAYLNRGGIAPGGIINISAGCNESDMRDKELGNQPIPMRGGNVEVDLYVCI